MTKITWKPGTLLAPVPPALITSGNKEHPNVMTAAWTGIICSEPVITYVSLRPSRYTHELVSQYKEFVINLPTWKEAAAVDTVGVKSGRDIDKFALTGLTAEPAAVVQAPLIAECPVSIECKVLDIRSFGTHDMFLAEVVAVNVDERYIDETGALDLEKAGLLAYAHGFYYTLGRKIGKFGFSVEKKKKNTPVAAKMTVLKADKKFGKEKSEEKFHKAQAQEKSFRENGVEVIIKKPRFAKPSKIKEREKPARHAGKPAAIRKDTAKFSRKKNKSTNCEPYSFKKKSDGSFKKNAKRKAG